MKRRLIKQTILSLLVIIWSDSFGQYSSLHPSPADHTAIPNTTIGRGLNVDIQKQTGAINISVPLYTITVRGLSVPIEIRYSNNGVKPTDVASNIGLGWDLVAGGAVIRTVNNRPDDVVDGYFSTGCPEVGTGILASEMELAAGKDKDYAPDFFTYIIPSGVGSFFIKNEQGNLRVVHTSQANINTDVTFSRDGNGVLIGFEIIDPTGTIYTFEEECFAERFSSEFEQDYAIEYDYPSTYFSFEDSIAAPPSPSPFPVHAYKWMLTKVEPANSDEIISFTYFDEYDDETRIYESYKYRDPGWIWFTGEISRTREKFKFHDKRISEINWSLGKVIFDFAGQGDRDDTECFNQSFVPKKAITGISIFNMDNDLIAKQEFEQSYMNPDGCPDGLSELLDCNCKRLMLDAVKQVGASGGSLNPIRFSYDSKPLPNRYTTGLDYWGYYNGVANDNFKPKLWAYPAADDVRNTLRMAHLPFPLAGYSSYEYVLEGANRTPSLEFARAGMLTSIKYPTGGTKDIEYEMNEFRILGETIQGAGLRVKRIVDRESASSQPINRTFNYSTPFGVSSGKALDLPRFFNSWNLTTYNPCWALFAVIPTNTTHAEALSEEGVTNSSSMSSVGSVLYEYVEEKFSGNGKVLTRYLVPYDVEDTEGLCFDGSCIYETPEPSLFYKLNPGPDPLSIPRIEDFSGCDFNTNMDYTPNPFLPNTDWCQGLVLEETTYNENGELVRFTSFNHEFEVVERIPTLAASVYSIGPILSFANMTIMKYCHYDFLSGYARLKSIRTEEYLGNQLLESSVRYLSNGSNQLYGTSSISSLGEQIKTEVKYVTEYNLLMDDIYRLPVNSMLSYSNYRSYPVESLKTLTDNYSREWVVGGSLQTYRREFIDSKIYYLPDKIYKLELETPLLRTAFNESACSNQSVPNLGWLIWDDHYSLVQENTKFNPKGLLKEFRPTNDVYYSNIYGHDDNLLIAEIYNAKQDEVGFTSFESDDMDDWTIDGGNTSTFNFKHCGDYCLWIDDDPNSGSGFDAISRTFAVDDQSGKYKLSAWVQTSSSFGTDKGKLVLSTYKIGSGNNNVWPTDASSITETTVSFSGSSSGWKYIEVFIDLDAIRDASSMITGSDILGVNVRVQNYDASHPYIIDDLRFRPEDAVMTSYTHSPLVGRTSVMNENDIVTYQEYDEFGRPKLTRDMDENITTRTRYNLFSE